MLSEALATPRHLGGAAQASGGPNERAWVARLYHRDDDAGLLALLRDAFGKWPYMRPESDALAYLRWKLGSSDEPRHAVAEAGGRLVGALPFIVQRVKVRDRVLLSRQGVDGCVHPAYQNLGIMSALRRFAREELDVFDLYLGARARHPAMRALSDRDGGDGFGNQVERLIQPLGIGATLQALRLRPGRAPRKLARDAAALARWAFQRAGGRGATEAPAYTIQTKERFDASTNALWERASRPYDFIIERRPDYLNWRYADRRGGPFEIRTAEDGEELLGYAVTRTARGRAYLADLLALPERDDVVRGLLRDASARARAAGAQALECWLPSHHPHQAAVRNAGFLRQRLQRLTYRALRPGADLAFLADPRSAVHLTMGDFDLV